MAAFVCNDWMITDKRNWILIFQQNKLAVLPNYRLMNVFLAKTALDALSFKTLTIPASNLHDLLGGKRVSRAALLES